MTDKQNYIFKLNGETYALDETSMRFYIDGDNKTLHIDLFDGETTRVLKPDDRIELSTEYLKGIIYTTKNMFENFNKKEDK